MRKLLLVVLEGMGDRPLSELGGRTPLEAAHTPLLDEFARRGQQGQMSTVAPDIAPESDAAVMSLLGYDVSEHYTGRGPLEALGAGLDMRDGDLAWRANFATVERGEIMDRRVGRSLGDSDASELAAAIQKDVHLAGASIQFVQTSSYHACLVIRSTEGPLSSDVENPDPAYRRHGRFSVAVPSTSTGTVKAIAMGSDDTAVRAAALTNSFIEQAFEALDQHPVNQRRRDFGFLPGNHLLLRDAGDRVPRLPAFSEMHGLRMGAVVDMPAEKALAQLMGMQVSKLARATGDLQRDFNEWALRTDEALSSMDGAYVHIKTPDIPSHDGDIEAKRAVLEAVDRLYLGRLGELVDLNSLLICVTADHATPVALRAHSNDPVPVLVCGSGEPDGAGPFGESSAAKGGLGYLMGFELMPRLVQLMRAGG